MRWSMRIRRRCFFLRSLSATVGLGKRERTRRGPLAKLWNRGDLHFVRRTHGDEMVTESRHGETHVAFWLVATRRVRDGSLYPSCHLLSNETVDLTLRVRRFLTRSVRSTVKKMDPASDYLQGSGTVATRISFVGAVAMRWRQNPAAAKHTRHDG